MIPSDVVLEGTLRTVSDETKNRCIEQINQICQSTANAYGAKASVEISVGYPATVNDPEVTDYTRVVGSKLFGADNVVSIPAPSMGGEDFSFYLQRVPGTFFFLGLGDAREGGYPSLHHPEFDFNDAALQIGVDMFVNLALGWAKR